MEALDRIFGQWTQDLAPGIGDKAGVIRDRILYRSAEEKSLPDASRRVDDAMNVDLGVMHMPLADPAKQARALVAEEKPSLPNASRRVGDAMNVDPEVIKTPLADPKKEASAMAVEQIRPVRDAATRAVGEMDLE